MPTTNRHLNIFTVCPSLRCSLPLTYNCYSPLLHHSTQSPFSPRCSNGKGCLRWRKARTYLGTPENASETTGSARRQPDHIHMDRLVHPPDRNIFRFWPRREPVPNRYAAQERIRVKSSSGQVGQSQLDRVKSAWLWIWINTLKGHSVYMQRERESWEEYLVPVRNSFPEAVYCLCTHNTVFQVVPIYDSFFGRMNS